MDNNDVLSVLNEKTLIKGVPIEKSEMCRVLSDMNVSDQYVSDYSNSFHNFLRNKGVDEAEKKVLTIFRINPLAAVKIIESCSLAEKIDELGYSIKILYYAIKNDGMINPDGVLLNKNKVPYVTLLIEAVFQTSISELRVAYPDMLLKYAQEEDVKLHKNRIKPKYLNAYNIRHMLTHIPENRQIELINWFWDKHCYAVTHYGKQETFSGGRVDIMMKELFEGSLWQHLENTNKSKLSETERERINRERDEIKRFISSVVSEGRHTQYVKIVIGSDNFYEKLRVLMGDKFAAEYDESAENQRIAEEQEEALRKQDEEAEKAKKELEKKYQRYDSLVQKVKKKYEKGNELLEWHNLRDNKNPQINLWTYWQGSNFENVKLMILGYDWGSINVDGPEMEKCKRKLRILMKSRMDVSTTYYSCKYQKTDYNLEELFRRCFNRDIRKNHYQDLFFSNLCLGYRVSSSTALDDELTAADINDFMGDELSIVCPQSIFCLGRKVYLLFVENIDPNGEDKTIEGEDNITLIYRDINIDGRPVRVYSVPGCGAAGIKRIPMDRQLEYWELAKNDMKQLGVDL